MYENSRVRRHRLLSRGHRSSGHRVRRGLPMSIPVRHRTFFHVDQYGVSYHRLEKQVPTSPEPREETDPNILVPDLNLICSDGESPFVRTFWVSSFIPLSTSPCQTPWFRVPPSTSYLVPRFSVLEYSLQLIISRPPHPSTLGLSREIYDLPSPSLRKVIPLGRRQGQTDDYGKQDHINKSRRVQWEFSQG